MMTREDFKKEMIGFNCMLSNVWKRWSPLCEWRMKFRRPAHDDKQPIETNLQIWAKMMNLAEYLEAVFFKSDQRDIERSKTEVIHGASLVVWWIRIHLPMQGTRVWPLIHEDSTCCRATKPSYTTSEDLERMLCNKRSHHNEKLDTLQLVAPALCN